MTLPVLTRRMVELAHLGHPGPLDETSATGCYPGALALLRLSKSASPPGNFKA
jgi:hypothetical protein